MHQSGHWRPHSMQTVQFSSLSAMTPRARGAGASFSCGYCTVTAGRSMVFNVTPRPPISPGSFGIRSLPSEGHLEHARQQDVDEAEGDEDLPREGLELVLAQPRIREPHPEEQERDDHQLPEQHE